MLKKLSIVFMVFVMVASMALPAVYAASLPSDDLPNKLIIQYKEGYGGDYNYYYVNWSFGSDYLDYDYIAYYGKYAVYIKSYSEIYGYFGKLEDDGSITWVLDKYTNQGSGFTISGQTEILFSTVDISEQSNYSNIVYKANTYCDNHFCETVDNDNNGYCDNCGLMVMAFFVPEPPDAAGASYALYYSGGYYYCLTTFYPLDSAVSSFNGGYRIGFNLEQPSSMYAYTNSGWSLFSENLTGYHVFDVAVADDIIHYPETLTFNGEDFFVPPLTLEQAIQKGVLTLLETMGAALLILVSLGVCLMASLIGLNLLRTLLLRYLH